MGGMYNLVFTKSNKDAKQCRLLIYDLIYKSRSASVTHYPYFSDDKGIYKLIRYYDLPLFLDLVKSGETKLPLEYVNRISNLPEDTNPILFYYEEK
jgi:hypothetical protein